MSTNKTANYELNQWELSDKPVMDEFNEDNKKIDAALSKKVNTGKPISYKPNTTEGYELEVAGGYGSMLYKNAFEEVTCTFAVIKKSGVVAQGDILFVLPEGFRPDIDETALAIPIDIIAIGPTTVFLGEANIFAATGAVTLNFIPQGTITHARVRGSFKFLAR